jgi:DNA-binding winged helix-turn-helix (wHTH) protein
MDVLADLVSRRGAVVSRDELERDVWRGALVCKDALTKTLIKLRKALGDDRHEPASMRTVPKPGYRLAAAVDRSAPPEGRASFVESRPIKRHHRSPSLTLHDTCVAPKHENTGVMKGFPHPDPPP